MESTLNSLMAHNAERPDFFLSYIAFILFLKPFCFSAPILVIKKSKSYENEIVFV